MTDPAVAQLRAAMRGTLDEIDIAIAIIDGCSSGQDNRRPFTRPDDRALPAIAATARHYGDPANLKGLSPSVIAMTFRNLAATAEGAMKGPHA